MRSCPFKPDLEKVLDGDEVNLSVAGGGPHVTQLVDLGRQSFLAALRRKRKILN